MEEAFGSVIFSASNPTGRSALNRDSMASELQPCLFRNGVHRMRKLASGSLIIALVGVCAASVGGQSQILAVVGERIRAFRVSDPLLLLLLGMCLIVSATALPPRLRGRFRARNSGSRKNRIHLTNGKRADEMGQEPGIPPQNDPSTHPKSSAAGIGS